MLFLVVVVVMVDGVPKSQHTLCVSVTGREEKGYCRDCSATFCF